MRRLAYRPVVQERERIQRTIEANGASYHKDLTKNVSHLIVATPQGAKFDRARQWGMKVVSYKWFSDSLQRGMVLDEKLYDPFLPVEQQGLGAFVSEPIRKNSPRKRLHDETDGGPTNGAKRTMRRSVSARMNSQSQELWAALPAQDQKPINTPGEPWAEAERTANRGLGQDMSAHIEANDSLLTDDHEQQQQNTIGHKAPARVLEVEERPGLFTGWVCLLHCHEEGNVGHRYLSAAKTRLIIVGCKVAQDLCGKRCLSCKKCRGARYQCVKCLATASTGAAIGMDDQKRHQVAGSPI